MERREVEGAEVGGVALLGQCRHLGGRPPSGLGLEEAPADDATCPSDRRGTVEVQDVQAVEAGEVDEGVDQLEQPRRAGEGHGQVEVIGLGVGIEGRTERTEDTDVEPAAQLVEASVGSGSVEAFESVLGRHCHRSHPTDAGVSGVVSTLLRVYRFVLRPRWILSHLLALFIVAACVFAGLWQLDRLQTRREVNERQAERAELPVVPVHQLVGPGDGEDAVDDVALRTVEVTGTYRLDDQVTVSNRTHEGAPGYWVLTPLVTSDGTGVVVNRGWVPMAIGDGERLVEADPPTVEVTVVGSLTASQQRGSFGATDPDEGRLERLARADIGRLAAQVDYPVLPAYVTLSGQAPAQAGQIPIPVEPIELGEGPHLGYTFQWFTFATIAFFGYPLVLRKVAHERAAEERGDPPPRRRSAAVPVDA